MQKFKFAAKIIGACLLGAAALTAVFFVAPYLLAAVSLKLAIIVSAVILGTTAICIGNLIASATSSYQKKGVVFPPNRGKEKEPEKEISSVNRHPRALRRIQAKKSAKPSPQKLQEFPKPKAPLKAENFTLIKSSYVHENILLCDEDFFRDKLRQALEICQTKNAEEKYILIKNNVGDLFVLELDGNSRHLYYKPETAYEGLGLSQQLGNFNVSGQTEFDPLFFEPFEKLAAPSMAPRK